MNNFQKGMAIAEHSIEIAKKQGAIRRDGASCERDVVRRQGFITIPPAVDTPMSQPDKS